MEAKIIHFILEKIRMARNARDKEIIRQIGNYGLVRRNIKTEGK